MTTMHCTVLYLFCGVLWFNTVFADEQEERYRFAKLTILTKATNEAQVSWEHAAVIRSLKEGLKELQVPHNYNPSTVDDIGDVVVVPCGKAALAEACRLKQVGRIKKLFVGPNFYPHEVNFPEVDIYIVPSAPVIEYVQAVCPALVPRCCASYAGVDHRYWSQQQERRVSNTVLIYWKTEGESFCHDVETILMQYGWQPVRIKYGSYNPQQYKELLSKCRFAVFLSRSESQGLALAEAWSMNVPTLCWNPMNATVQGKTYTFLPSCPYLNDQVGRMWKSREDFEKLLQAIQNLLPTFQPRAWVEEHMTDAIAVRLFINIVNEELAKEQ